jgi:hypothetical protein
MKRAKPKPPRIPETEKEQVRIRRALEYDFAVKQDGYGRDRLAQGTAEATRQYERTRDGYVRVRISDPLATIKTLTDEQRAAAEKYRDAFELAASYGVKPASWDIRVDGGGFGGAYPDRVLDALKTVREADRCMSHREIRQVVQLVCIAGDSFRAMERHLGIPRAVSAKLLSIGLDQVAEYLSRR